MNVLEKALAQIFLAYKVIYNEKVVQYISELRNELQIHDTSIDVIFFNINSAMRTIGLEIRSLVIIDDDGCRQQIHGVVNMDDDYVAKHHGSDYTAGEVQFFKDLCLRLVEERHLSTSDILQGRKNDWSGIETERFLFRLHDDHWLERDAANFWIIGPRTHLELRSLIESTIRSSEGENNELIEERLSELPQILFY